jgi:hypothetical protein
MLIKVIFSDGSLGMVRASRLVKFVKMGKIAAYQPFDDWVEIRRKRNTGYKGSDRRVNAL